MKISVVIPVYNGEKYIAQCLENVLCQTYKDLEVIVINDGSTDRTAEIAATYPVKLINQENRGLSLARNRGAEEVTGDYIHFMDVDDFINRDYYKNMAEAISGTEADMAFGGYIDEGRRGLSVFFDDKLVLTNLEDKMMETRVGLHAYAWRYLIRKSFMDANRLEFIPGRLMEDMPFVLEAVRLSNKIVTVPGATYYYKMRDGSILNSRNREFIKKREEHWRLAKELRREFIAKHGLGSFYKPLDKFEYKLFGAIPVMTKILYNNGRSKWFLFGMLVMQKKSIKI
jgi:glycosyltransferase involved in cell wall biosynthesis